ECDAAVGAELAWVRDRAGGRHCTAKPRRCGQKANDLSFDAAGPLLRAVGVDLTEVEGIDARTALVILAEVGADVGRFPTEKHFASWLGVCPRQHESNGVRKRRGARGGDDRGGGGVRGGWRWRCGWRPRRWAGPSPGSGCSTAGSRGGSGRRGR